MPKRLRPIIRVIGPSIAYVPLTRGLFASVDVEDIPLVEAVNWQARSESRSDKFYAGRSLNRDIHGYAVEIMHRVILGLSRDDPRVGDHITPALTLNNCRYNLRAATCSQNSQNRSIMSNCTNGTKGIYLRKDRYGTKFVVRLMREGRRIYMGTTTNLEDAKNLAARGVHEIHGEFARLG